MFHVAIAVLLPEPAIATAPVPTPRTARPLHPHQRQPRRRHRSGPVRARDGIGSRRVGDHDLRFAFTIATIAANR